MKKFMIDRAQNRLFASVERDSLFFGLVGCIAVLSILRVLGVNPSVIDERVYIANSLYLDYAAQGVPDYVYRTVYSYVTKFGGSWYSAAQILNVTFLFLGSFFCLLTARMFLSRQGSRLVFLLCLLGPVSTYSSFFMPESMFFFGFWLFIYSVSFGIYHKRFNFVALGVFLLGVLAYVKPHANILLVSVLAYLCLDLIVSKEPFLTWVKKYVVCGACFLIPKIYFAIIIGSNSVLGADYSRVGATAVSAMFEMSTFVQFLGAQLIGIGAGLFVFYGAAGVIGIIALRSVFEARNDPLETMMKSMIFFVLAICCAVGLSAFFAATGGGTVLDPIHAARVHTRYFSYGYGLLAIMMMVGYEQYPAFRTLLSSKLVTFFICISGLIVCVAFGTNLFSLTPNYVDSPDFNSLLRIPFLFSVFSVVSLIIAIQFLRGRNMFGYSFLFAGVLTCFTWIDVARHHDVRRVDHVLEDLALSISDLGLSHEHGYTDVLILGPSENLVWFLLAHATMGKKDVDIIYLNEFDQHVLDPYNVIIGVKVPKLEGFECFERDQVTSLCWRVKND